MTVTRRALLAGALGAAGVVAGCGGSRSPFANPSPGAPPSTARAASDVTVVSGAFRSAARRGRVVRWEAAYPPGSPPGSPLPVALVLHGRGDDATAAFGSHRLDRFLADAVHTGTPPYALVAVDGGDHTYWHARGDGDDPQQMLVGELLPMLRARGLRTTRIGLSGWSMGGYGALLLAERLGAAGCAVVAVDSPALWLHAGDSAPGAFDDRADFERHDVFPSRGRLHGVPVRIAIGRTDPFLVATRAFAAGLPGSVLDVAAGGHTVEFWRRAAPAQLRFLGAHLG